MKVLLVVNEAASSVTARRQVIISKLIAADHDVTVAKTHRRDHATQLAQGAARTGTEVVMVLGGDGTLNEVANGLVGTDCAVAALPGGSTNVFSRALGLSDDPIESALTNLDAMTHGSIRSMGLGSANGRYFTFHVGIGWDAALVEQVERRAEMKRWANHALFIYAGLRTFFGTYDRRRPHFRVRHDDGRRIDDAYFAVVLKLNPYTFVGSRPFNLAPQATLDSPLTAVVVRSMRSIPFLGLLASALNTGERLQHTRSVDYSPDVEHLVIDAIERRGAPGGVPYQVDGDYLGTVTHLELRFHPDALRVVVPRSSALLG